MQPKITKYLKKKKSQHLKKKSPNAWFNWWWMTHQNTWLISNHCSFDGNRWVFEDAGRGEEGRGGIFPSPYRWGIRHSERKRVNWEGHVDQEAAREKPLELLQWVLPCLKPTTSGQTEAGVGGEEINNRDSGSGAEFWVWIPSSVS